jgi:hypothetical protein
MSSVKCSGARKERKRNGFSGSVVTTSEKKVKYIVSTDANQMHVFAICDEDDTFDGGHSDLLVHVFDISSVLLIISCTLATYNIQTPEEINTHGMTRSESLTNSSTGQFFSTSIEVEMEPRMGASATSSGASNVAAEREVVILYET